MRTHPTPSQGYYNGVIDQPVSKLEKKLWSGFESVAFPLLVDKALAENVDDIQRSEACYALGRWHYFGQRFELALEYAQLQCVLNPNARGRKSQIVLEVMSQLFGNEVDAAQRYLVARIKKKGFDPDLWLLHNNCLVSQGEEKTAERLATVNEIYQRAGFETVMSTTSSLSLLTLRGANERQSHSAGAASQAKISILMPVFNAGEQLEIALGSLLRQHWQHLEIIAVDDCSTDNSLEILKRFQLQDDRVRVFAQQENGGAYRARNRALDEASGDFITVHDSDDWSHPQKLAVQVQYLTDHPAAVATVTDWARATASLFFTGTFRLHGSLISENTSSLMYRAEVIRALGGWDTVRTSADTEMQWRVGRLYGPDSVVRLHRGVPLSFALDQVTSLTRTPATHAKTIYYGARRNYREAARHWHETLEAGTPIAVLPRHETQSPFPAPRVLQLAAQPGHYDLVVISDFNLSGGAFISTWHYIQAALQGGLKVAVFQWRRFDLDVTSPLNPKIQALAHEGLVHVLTAGDEVSVETVMVGYPVVLNYALDAVPAFTAKRALILVNQMDTRLRTGADRQYDFSRVLHNARETFGVDPVFVPISGTVQALLKEQQPQLRLSDQVWTPLNDLSDWTPQKPRRAESDRLPTIGRHGRDHYTKWPATPAAIAAAYCADQDCEVHLLGGAHEALKLLGHRPGNWTVQEYSDSTEAFLQGLDFFVHFPHEDYIEEYGRAVLEAMTHGLPVILPPVFRPTFGPSATYAESDEVWPCINRIWQNPELYQAYSQRSLDYVKANAGYEVLIQRLKNFKHPTPKNSVKGP